ncbi:cell division protein FtsL [Pendulispora brunnea]|uniref:Cell division protein FtsL n=1 Tax=Pendulispora brunnea TaxID=2905690 RepID=A0ABZ2K331_9BACT
MNFRGLLQSWGKARSGTPRQRAAVFVTVWTLAIVATVLAFVLHLALRGRTVALGYELGRARAEQARLREVKRVLEVEAASYKTPERVDIVARTLLGMEPPTPDRMIVLPALQDSDRSPPRAPENADAGSATVAATP